MYLSINYYLLNVLAYLSVKTQMVMATHFIISIILIASVLSHITPHHHHNHNHIPRTTFSVPPPAQDQCKPVDAKEPPQCPKTIGPPWYFI